MTAVTPFKKEKDLFCFSNEIAFAVGVVAYTPAGGCSVFTGEESGFVRDSCSALLGSVASRAPLAGFMPAVGMQSFLSPFECRLSSFSA